MSGNRIIATAHAVPETIVTNDDLAALMPTSDEWIQQHTGIKTRHIALNENTSDLATRAAEAVLARAGVAAETIDMIIVSTFTPDGLAPSTAALVQSRIGATQAWAYDISTACAGFVFALSTADKFLAGVPDYRRALVIAAEVNSKMMDFSDRTSTVFFGDGAGAVLLEKQTAAPVIAAESLHTIGNAEVVHSGKIEPLTALTASHCPTITPFHQSGRDVFQEVARLIPPHIQTLLETQGLTPADVDYYITHQANLRLIEVIATALDQPLAKFTQNVVTYGNTSSAGIAIGLDQLAQTHDLTGKRVLLTGFGAGFSYGSVLLDM